MNYSGSEQLRADVTALCDTLHDVRANVSGLESQFGHDAATLAERIAVLSLRRINGLLMDAYREALVLDGTFQD